MSVRGPSRTSGDVQLESGKCPKADLDRANIRGKEKPGPRCGKAERHHSPPRAALAWVRPRPTKKYLRMNCLHGITGCCLPTNGRSPTQLATVAWVRQPARWLSSE